MTLDPAVITAAGAVLVAAVAAGGSVITAIVSRKVHENTKPIGNGFAGDVTRRLERIEGLIIDHLEDHASADLSRKRRGDTW